MDSQTMTEPGREGKAAPAEGVSGADIHAVTANSLAVGVWTVFARLTGLGRVVAIAAVLGPTFFGNLFQATNTVPNLIYEFLAGNLIVSLLVPRLVPHVDRDRHGHAEKTAGQFLAVLLSIFGIVAAVTLAVGPWLLDFLSFGVDNAEVRADQRSAGWVLLALLVPQVFLYAVAGVGMAVQHAYGKYRLATAAYSAENVGVMAVVLASGAIFGSGIDVGEVTTSHLLFLGIGTTAAVAVHAGVQWWGAWRVGVVLRPRLGWRSNPELRTLLRLGVPSLGYAGLNAARLLGLIAVAGSIPGGVVAFQMAFAFYQLPIAVGARPVAWAMVPHLTRLHHSNDRSAFTREWSTGLAMSAFLVLPAVAGYLVLAEPLARVFSLGEMATPTGIGLVTAALVPLALGIPGETTFIHASHGLYARSDARRPFEGMVLRVGLAVVGMIVTASVATGRDTLIALAITVVVSDLVSGGYLASRILRRSKDGRRLLGGAVTRAAVASVVMAAPVAGIRLLGRDVTELLPRTGVILGAIAVGAIVYVSLQRLAFGAPEGKLIAANAGSLFRRSKP